MLKFATKSVKYGNQLSNNLETKIDGMYPKRRFQEIKDTDAYIVLETQTAGQV